MAFDAKNKTNSSIKLLIDRARYRTSAFEAVGLSEGNEVTDFTFAEFVNYGRINSFSDTIIVQREQLTAVRSNSVDNNVLALPFVASAFHDMVTDFEKASLLQKIPKDEQYFSKIQPVMGYADPMVSYQSYIEQMMDDYMNEYIINNNSKHILSIDSYLKNFITFMKHRNKTMPITLTSWQRSKHSSIFTSGLAISLTNLPMDHDKQKIKFMSSKVFPYFKKVCINRGFAISHNSPWVIVADLDSPRMAQYYPPRTISPRGVFNKYYTLTYNQDIDILKNNIIRYYNRFVNLFPHEKNINYCKSNKTIISYDYRTKSNMDQLNKSLSPNYWYYTYTSIRNMEEGSPFTETEIKNITRQAIQLNKIFDNQRAIDYISEQFRAKMKNKYGGLNSILKRFEQKNKQF